MNKNYQGLGSRLLDLRLRQASALAACLLFFVDHATGAVDPIYETAPEWVEQTDIPVGAATDSAEPLRLLLWDQQLRIDRAERHVYTRIVWRIEAPQGLTGLNTLSAEWSPDFQTLRIHHARIRRGQDDVDLLGRGQRFAVLRRESNLEFAMVDGVLTAALQPEGLRVGDIVDFAFTLTGSDPVLAGQTQTALNVPQFSIEQVRMRASWDSAMNVRWQATDSLQDAVQSGQDGRWRIIELLLDRHEPYAPPAGAPGRYLLQPHIELSSYNSWQQVSSQMAPLFNDAVALPDDSLVREEIDRILADHDTPLDRANAALRLVQQEVRYLYVALGFGGFVPASAEQTWLRRYGDCKGKSALLLALLHGLGIEAEPVLVQSVTGDALPGQLPAVGVFDHVIVRAEIGGTEYWLDGTVPGGSSIERSVTPVYHWGLPVRAEGAELVEVLPAPLTEPDVRLALRVDYSAGVTAPADVEAELVFRGQTAAYIEQSIGTLSPAEADQTLRSIWASYYPAAQVAAVDGSYSDESGEFSISMTGTAPSQWSGRRYRSAITDLVVVQQVIARSDESDEEAPYAVAFPSYVQVTETLLLPQQGQGFSMEGSDIDLTVLGVEIRRSSRIDGSNVAIEGSARSLVTEISTSQVHEGERRLASLGRLDLFVVAPTDYRPSAEEQEAVLGPEPVSDEEYINRGVVHLDNRRFEPAIADFTAAIELAPENSYGWANRGLAHVWQRDIDRARADLERAESLDPANAVVFRAYGLLAMQRADEADAVEQFTRSIEIDPRNAFAFAMRASARMELQDMDGAFEDSRSATRLDPTFAEPYFLRATINGLRGRQDQAMEELRAMLEEAYVVPATFRLAAQAFARFDEREEAIEAISKAYEVQPMAGDLIFRAGLRPEHEISERQADLEAALELDPLSREARLGLADLHIAADRAAEAVAVLEELLQRDAEDVQALGARGIARALSGADDSAVVDFEAARAYATTASELNFLCWQKATLGLALEQALSDCMRALEFGETSAVRDSLGLVLLRLGRHDEAIETYNLAIGLSGSNAFSYFGRAIAKRALGDQAGYEFDRSAALRLSPGIEDTFEGYGLIP